MESKVDNKLLQESILSATSTDLPNNTNDTNDTNDTNEPSNTLCNSSDAVDIIPKIWLFLTKEENRVKRRNERELRLKQREQELKGKLSPKKALSDYTDIVNELKDSKNIQWYMKAFDNAWSIPTIKVVSSSIRLEHGTVVYKVLVKEISGKEWYVYRRYSDFLSVAEYLETLDDKEFAPTQAHKIPPKDWNLKNRVLFPLNEKRLEERRLGLEAWLQDLLCFAKEELSVHRLSKRYQAKLRIELAAFLDPPDDDDGVESSFLKSVASLDQNNGDDNPVSEDEDGTFYDSFTRPPENDVSTIPNPPPADLPTTSTNEIPSKVLTLEEEEFLYEYTRKKREQRKTPSEIAQNDTSSIDTNEAQISSSTNPTSDTREIYQQFINEVKDINIENETKETKDEVTLGNSSDNLPPTADSKTEE